jgi:hypothetical protein
MLRQLRSAYRQWKWERRLHQEERLRAEWQRAYEEFHSKRKNQRPFL